MRRPSLSRRALAPAAAALLALVASATPAGAGCDNIPSESDVYRGAQGSLDAPFAVPGQTLEVRVRPQVCDARSPGLGAPPACASPAGLRVTVLYEPGGGAPRHAVVLARDCGNPADPASLHSRVSAWAAQLGPGGSAVCQTQPQLEVAPADTPTTQECRLRFVFPAATGPSLAAPDTLVGPARIVVENVASPLPAAVVGRRCADGAGSLGSIACVDELYARDGTCATAAANVDSRFPSFTALPVANDFRAMTGAASGPRPTLRCALGGGGATAYCPFDWRGVLCQTDPSCTFQGFPPPQLVEVAFPGSMGSGLDATGAPAASGVPLAALPGGAESLTAYGTQLPPLFDPSAVGGQLGYFGSTDALQTVLAFRLAAPGRCSGDQRPCVLDSGCASGQTCDLAAPDTRLADLGYCRHPNACAAPNTPVAAQPPSGGPVQIPASLYTATTGGLIDLASLNLCRGSSDVTCLVRSERLAGQPLNDADVADPAVLTLRATRTGAPLGIGLDGTSPGLATVLRHTPPAAVGPFGAPIATPPTLPSVVPTVTARGGCVALLWPEPWENALAMPGADANGDGEVFDPILRAFCLDAASPGGVREVSEPALLAAGLPRQTAASAAPRIFEEKRTLSPIQGGGDALVASGDWLYLLLDDGANAVQAVQRADVPDGGAPGGAGALADGLSISADGSRVCFASSAELVPGARSRSGGPHAYCRDLATSRTELVAGANEPPATGPLCAGEAIRPNGASFRPSLSDDGRLVCFDSLSSNLQPAGGDLNGRPDVYLRNLDTCETVRVSRTETGGEPVRGAFACSLAGAGSAAVFFTEAPLTAADTDGRLDDVYLTAVHRGTDASADPTRIGAPILVSGGLPGFAYEPSLSRDGQRVAFQHLPLGGAFEVHVRDVVGGVVSDPLGFAVPGREPRLSADGRLLTVQAPNAATGVDEVFVIDLATSIARQQLIAAPAALTSTLDDVGAESVEGAPAAGAVAFTSPAALLPGDPPGVDGVRVRDVVTQLLKRLGGASATGAAAISADGASVAYASPVGGSGLGIFRSGPILGSATGQRLVALDLVRQPPALEIVGPAVQAAVAGDTAAALAPDGSVVVRTCAPGGACAIQSLLAPGTAQPVQASAVVASDRLVCALLAGSAHVACAPTGSAALSELQAGGQPLAARAIGASGPHVVFVSDAAPARLRVFTLTGGAFVPTFESAPGVRRFVLGGDGWAAFDRCELDLGADLDGDGLDDECRLEVVDLDAAQAFDTQSTVLPCTNAACDASFPFRVFRYGANGQGVLVRFLSSEAQEGRQLDGDPADAVIVREWTPQQQYVLTALGDVLTGDPLAGDDSGGTGSGQGGAFFPSLVGRCDADADPTTSPTTLPCQTDADCPASSPTCGPPFSLLALNDGDDDGVFDPFDNCPAVFNPDQLDGDGDGVGNACEGPSCGDGRVDAGEICDEGPRNGACRGLSFEDCRDRGAAGSFCAAECRPEVFLRVLESSVNPRQTGVLPTRIYGTPYLNLGAARPFDGVTCKIPGGCPAAMISLPGVRLEGVVSGAACSGLGAPIDSSYVDDETRDGIRDLQAKFRVPQARIERGDTQACVTGALRAVEGRFPATPFETRAPLRVR